MRLRQGNKNPQNLYLIDFDDDDKETFFGVAMTEEFAVLVVERFNRWRE